MATLERWRITIVTAIGTAAVLIAAGWLIAGGADRNRRAVANGTDTTPVPVPSARGGAAAPSERLGPESVPLLEGRLLGPAQSPAPGEASGGIPCGSSEQLTYHVHARLSLFVDGRPRSVPLGIGIGKPVKVTETPDGPFAAGGRCFSFLHTHAADGIVHIEAPRSIVFKLGQLFDVWRQPLGPRRLGGGTGRMVAYVNGRRYRGDPRGIDLKRHVQIQLELGRPLVAPLSIAFPPGL